jgi:hypothetical protein
VTATRPRSTHRNYLSLRTATGLAWGLWAATVVATVAALVLLYVTRSVPRPAHDQWQLSLLAGSGMLAYATVGLIIAARRPGNSLGWLLLLIGLTLGMNRLLQTYADYTLTYRPGALPGGLAVGWVATWNWALILPLTPFLFLLFPNGRLPSRRWRPIAWAAGLAGGLILLMVPFRAGGLEYFPTIENPVGIPALSMTLFQTSAVIYFAIVFLATTSLLVRFRRARGDERQQLKWVAYAAVYLGIVGFVGPWSGPAVVASALSSLSSVAFAAAIAVAVLKYRLYAIDKIINRTLVYGLLTALLAGVYVGAVLVLGQVFGGISTEPPSWAVAGATLAVAALFQPARRRIQQVVDRRFNRRKYDTAKTIEAYSMRLRDQVDLDTLSAELLAVVDQTMQPTRASLWLRPSTQEPQRPAS